MDSRIHLISRTARSETLARRELGAFGITIEAQSLDPGQADPALRRLGLANDEAAVLSTPNLIMAATSPADLSTWLQWIKTHPPVILEEEITPDTPAMSAKETLPALPSPQETPQTQMPVPSDTPASKPAQTRQQVALQIRERLAQKLNARNMTNRQTDNQRRGEYTREHDS